MQETTSSEYIDWQTYIEWEANQHTPERWYLAQIAYEVYRTTFKADNVGVKNFLMRFIPGGADAAPKISREEAIARDKAAWCMAVGVQLPLKAVG